MLPLLYFWENSPPPPIYQLKWSLGGLQSLFGRSGAEKFFALPGIEVRSFNQSRRQALFQLQFQMSRLQ
jgi:hypothetical protein